MCVSTLTTIFLTKSKTVGASARVSVLLRNGRGAKSGGRCATAILRAADVARKIAGYSELTVSGLSIKIEL